jgi:hypothetical protein
MITGLDIRIENPVLVLKDRPYNNDSSIKIDLGLINITSKLDKNFGRWLHFEDKQVLQNVMTIDMENVNIGYEKKGKHKTITPNFHV